MRARILAAASAVVSALVIASRAAAQPAPPRPAPPPPTKAPPPASTDGGPGQGADAPAGDAAPPPISGEGAPSKSPAPSGDPDDAYEPDDQLRAIGEAESDPSQHHYFPLNLSFIYPLATNVGDPNRSTNIDVGVLFTKIGYLYGVQTGMLASVSQRMVGLQVGLGAITEGRTEGAQVAAAFAMSDAPFNGLQIGGVFSWSRFRFNGVQISGVANQARKHFAGLQVAGGINLARKTAHGVQIAGLMNIGGIEGIQLAPINISDNVDGLQIGLVNIARNVKGVQIGLVNIASELEGESIGAASVPKSGGIHGVAWGSSSLYGNFGLKFASHFTYSIFSASFHFEGKDKLMGPGFTFGFFHPFLKFLTPDLFLHADIGGYRMFNIEGAQRSHDEIYKTRLLLRYSVVRHLSIFVGGGAFLGIRDVSARQKLEAHPPGSPVLRWGPEFDAGIEL